jgi:uncharacterized protein YciI
VIDENMMPHMAFVEKHYQSGHFLASGRKEPRNGGIILAKANSLAEIELIIDQDPFKQKGLVEYRIINFKATKKIKAYDAFADDELEPL